MTTGEPVTPDRAEAVLELAKTQTALAEGLTQVATAVEDNVGSTDRFGSEVRRLRRVLTPLIILAAACSAAVAATFGVLQGVVREESAEQQLHLDCMVAVLFRQDPPACPGFKEELIRDGVLPPGFPATTTTRP